MEGKEQGRIEGVCRYWGETHITEELARRIMATWPEHGESGASGDGCEVCKVDGWDSKYGRIAVNFEGRFWRRHLTIDEFYGGAVID